MHGDNRKRQLSQSGLARVPGMTLAASIAKNGLLENTHKHTSKEKLGKQVQIAMYGLSQSHYVHCGSPA
jgi:hypothetical protein